MFIIIENQNVSIAERVIVFIKIINITVENAGPDSVSMAIMILLAWNVGLDIACIKNVKVTV